MIGATQKPLASVIGSLVKANFPVRLVGRVASTDDAKVAAGVPGTGAERLPGKGAFLLLRGGEMKRVQTHLLPHEHLLANVETAQRYWRKYARPTWPLSQEPMQDSRPMVTVIAAPASAQAYPTWLADLVANYIREHGQPPSQRAVQQAYRDETGQMLNWEGIKAAIADGTTQTGGATHA